MPRVVLGVTGCIAAYKACEILRELQRREVDVHVVMTTAATRFVGPLTFEALSGHPVFHDQFALGTAPANVAAAQRGDAGGIVASVFEAPERLDQDGCRLLISQISDDSAHAGLSSRLL